MSDTPNFGLPRPVEDANVDDEFRRLQNAWDLLDAILTVMQAAIAGKATLGHVHTIAQINGLASALAGKMDASKTYAIGDLTDVTGAAQAAAGYILAKTASGFSFASAASLLGVHEHRIAEVVGLASALSSLDNAVASKASNSRVDLLQAAFNELAIAAAGVPIGTIIDVYGNGTTIPPGFLKVVPGLEITTAYPELRIWALQNGWAVNGSGNPVFPSTDDALFKRQWRAGQTLRDAGRAFGTVQADAMQGHKHNQRGINSLPLQGGSTAAAADAADVVNRGQTSDPITDGVNGVPRTAAETRVANVTVTWFIRAYNSPLDTATVASAQVLSDLADARARTAVLENKSAWELIAEINTGLVSAIDITNLGAFDKIWIKGTIHTSVGGIPIGLVSVDNGASFINAAQYEAQFVVGNGSTAGAAKLAGQNGMNLSGGSGVASNPARPAVLDWTVLNFNKATYCQFQSEISDMGGNYLKRTGGDFSGVVARNALRLIASTGTIAGKFSVMGKRA